MAAAPPPLVGSEAFDPMHSSSSPSSSSDHSLVQLELLRIAFATLALFPKLPNLRSLLEEPSIGQRDIANSLFGSKLLHIFSEAGLKPSLGFNQGTRRLSLTLPLIPVHRVDTAQQVVLCAMLGLLAQQATLESIYQQQLLQQQEAAEDTQQPQRQTDRLLANACLRLFMEQTCVAVVEKKVNFRLQHVSIAMESAALKLHSAKDRSLLFTDSKRVPFWYCPCYLQLSGYSASEQCFSEEQLAVDRERLLQRMMEAFWENVMMEANYHPSPDLKTAVSEGLERYLRSSLSHGSNVNQAARFSPSPSASSSNSNLFRLYLHGGAGTGKSSFVAALRMSLERILRTFLQPDKTCVIVKLPLDFLSPEALAKELLVKGISDWSVERVCEQSLCKGKLVILHLEENPQDPQLQAELLTLLQRMLSALASRYPVESKTNLIQVFTSNFVPIEPISSDPSTAVVLVKPPIAEQQGRICAHMLSELVKRATGASSVNVLLQCAPPIAADMRPIHKWKISISHVIARQLLLLQKSNNKQERKNEEHDALSDAHIQLLLCDGSSTSSVSPSASPCSQHKHLLQVLYALQPNSKLLPLASLVSEDAYFFYEESQSTSQAQQEQQENPISPAVDAVLSLTFQKVLTPGVIVLTGPSTSTLPLKDSLLAHIRHHPLIGSEGQAHITEVELREEKDKEKVLGPYWEFPRGGLFKFIDQINNPNSAHRRQHEHEYAIVVAHANRLGQHFLCELLDANRAATHRQAVCKDGVLFVVVVEEGFDVISTIFSRAQVTLRL